MPLPYDRKGPRSHPSGVMQYPSACLSDATAHAVATTGNDDGSTSDPFTTATFQSCSAGSDIRRRTELTLPKCSRRTPHQLRTPDGRHDSLLLMPPHGASGSTNRFLTSAFAGTQGVQGLKSLSPASFPLSNPSALVQLMSALGPDHRSLPTATIRACE